MDTAFYTVLAIIAFAANSLLCRIALHGGLIDAATFSTIRFASGAVTLLMVTALTERRTDLKRSWASPVILFVYAIPFSFAYTGLTTGTGALILFGSVQLTMMVVALATGERPRVAQWFGLTLAVGGLIYLVRPGLAAPPALAAALMVVAGVGWGIYSLVGRGATNPLAATTSNFVRVLPLLVIVNLIAIRHAHAESKGILLAVASGTIASGLGYVAWYRALRGLSRTRAAVVQLAVPIVAAAGGALVLGELVSGRLLVATAMILGGIALAIAGRQVT